MDTHDKAAALADPDIADALNEEWLVLSSRSLARRHDSDDLEHEAPLIDHHWSTNSWSADQRPCESGTKRPKWGLLARRHGRQQQQTESSWLLGGSSGHQKRTCLLYDNISFADSPLISESANKRRRPTSDNLNQGLHWPPLADFHSYSQAADNPSQALAADKPVGRFRIFLSFFVLIGITLAIYSRNALSLAAVGMLASNQVNKELVDYLATSTTNNSDGGIINQRIRLALDGSCPIDGGLLISPKKEATFTQERSKVEAEFRESVKRRLEAGELVDWTPGQQGLIFAAGSLGNLMMAIPLTRLGEMYGPKWVICGALLGASLQAALMPLLAPSPVILVILFQILFNGLTFGADCAAYTLFAHWLTPTEMAFFVASLLVCYQSGTIISSFITAQILARQLPWSWCFYAPAILCAAWTCLWALIGASEPAQSWLISRRELHHLQRHSKIAQVATSTCIPTANDEDGASRQVVRASHQPVSWSKLARDPNIWAIIAVKFTLRWYFSVYNSLMPTYLSSVAHMSVETIGQVSVFQNLVGLLSGLLMSYLTKSVVLHRPFQLSLAAFRKIFQSIVNFGLAISLLIFIAFDCNKWVTIVTLTISGICLNFYVGAAVQLPLDLSPDHCGLITSLSNTLALGQTLGAPISGLILNRGPRERHLWRLVWLLVILLNTLSGLLFIYLVDSKQRDYNKYPQTTTTTADNKQADVEGADCSVAAGQQVRAQVPGRRKSPGERANK